MTVPYTSCANETNSGFAHRPPVDQSTTTQSWAQHLFRSITQSFGFEWLSTRILVGIDNLQDECLGLISVRSHAQGILRRRRRAIELTLDKRPRIERQLLARPRRPTQAVRLFPGAHGEHARHPSRRFFLGSSTISALHRLRLYLRGLRKIGRFDVVSRAWLALKSGGTSINQGVEACAACTTFDRSSRSRHNTVGVTTTRLRATHARGQEPQMDWSYKYHKVWLSSRRDAVCCSQYCCATNAISQRPSTAF